MIRFYSEEKLDAIMEFLKVEIEDVHVWSDNSITIGDNDITEYYVTKGKRKYSELQGRINGFNIYKQ
ncbi:hypothetical protein BSK59_13135 [Paenibacillus odorifer]|uniref:hypothetical protein n=1 Tax=Paenibacillus odorifer TaxID=189426 RepID=UPI00096BEEC1|nr:hypothetical protein [Paenibacillus odorifer]OME55416.1 hypothetical protein BSK59_13135 [Paenibacillus odorifer]